MGGTRSGRLGATVISAGDGTAPMCVDNDEHVYNTNKSQWRRTKQYYPRPSTTPARETATTTPPSPPLPEAWAAKIRRGKMR